MSSWKDTLFYEYYPQGKRDMTGLNYMPGGMTEQMWSMYKDPWAHFMRSDDQTESSYWDMLAKDYANQHEIDMWNLQNEYNSPANQMKRMVDAGLNPNLFYQQGNPGNATSAPGTHVASFQTNRRGYAMELANMALQSINTFANGILKFAETNANLDKVYNVEIPLLNQQIFEKKMSNEFFNTTKVGTLDEIASLFDGAAPETDLYPLYKNSEGQQVYAYMPKLGQNPKAGRLILDIGKSEWFNQFQDEYQRHLKAMYPEEEKRAAAQAAIQQYMESMYKSMPPWLKAYLPVIQTLTGMVGFKF